MINRARLRRWHIWLGWIIAVPMLVWTTSGLVMVAKPIEEVRGNHLMAEPKPMRLGTPPVAPRIEGIPLSSLTLQQRAAGLRWVVTAADGRIRLADPATGALLPPLSAAEAVREVAARYLGEAKVKAVTRTDPADPPLDLRRDIAAWQVALLRFHVGPAHHGPADPRGHAQPVRHPVRADRWDHDHPGDRPAAAHHPSQSERRRSSTGGLRRGARSRVHTPTVRHSPILKPVSR